MLFRITYNRACFKYFNATFSAFRKEQYAVFRKGLCIYRYCRGINFLLSSFQKKFQVGYWSRRDSFVLKLFHESYQSNSFGNIYRSRKKEVNQKGSYLRKHSFSNYQHIYNFTLHIYPITHNILKLYFVTSVNNTHMSR